MYASDLIDVFYVHILVTVIGDRKSIEASQIEHGTLWVFFSLPLSLSSIISFIYYMSLNAFVDACV